MAENLFVFLHRYNPNFTLLSEIGASSKLKAKFVIKSLTAMKLPH